MLLENEMLSKWLSEKLRNTSHVPGAFEGKCFEGRAEKGRFERGLVLLYDLVLRGTRGHPISNSTLFKDRVRIGTDYGLYLSPVQIHDDGRKFTCNIVVRPGRVLRSSTTVKVFGKFLFSGVPAMLLLLSPDSSPAKDETLC